MNKYRVDIEETTVYTYQVEAENEEYACDLAMDAHLHGNDSAERVNVEECKPEDVLCEEL